LLVVLKRGGGRPAQREQRTFIDAVNIAAKNAKEREEDTPRPSGTPLKRGFLFLDMEALLPGEWAL
jgi:hypothetical protein